MQHLPRLFAVCMKCMHSGNLAVAKMAAEVLIVRFLLFSSMIMFMILSL